MSTPFVLVYTVAASMGPQWDGEAIASLEARFKGNDTRDWEIITDMIEINEIGNFARLETDDMLVFQIAHIHSNR